MMVIVSSTVSIHIKYNLVLENSQNYNCLSEKIYDSLLCWCMPIYWGCQNIADFHRRFLPLIEQIDDPTRRLLTLSVNHQQKINVNAISDLDNFLDRYNLWNEIESIIAGVRFNHYRRLRVS